MEVGGGGGGGGGRFGGGGTAAALAKVAANGRLTILAEVDDARFGRWRRD